MTFRKTRSHSSQPTKKSGQSQAHNKTKKKSASAKIPNPEVDLLSTAAMENLFYISHNAAHCLEFRGFGWSNKSKSRKKTKGKNNTK
ncbi:small lysine-rich protein 1 isoform X2 [Periophthalmus magnuspinnatus]|uniref:small lysine-rich protein 1 isoform X2 n=1 Tax=Periophthalmus magnuspinnatus TaxID=409849 RepID=UPI002436AFBC|nr:small lysine-rich protein 1 isoform X2 [Periophthalmus magnuspinnatus]